MKKIESIKKNSCKIRTSDLQDKPLRRVSRGQSLVEYLVIVSLVAILGINAFKALGKSIHVAAVESVEGITNQSP